MKYLKLFEKFKDNKIFCYHATGNKTKDWKNILKDKFKIGEGANFGPGIYTFYFLDDLKRNISWNKSPVIIEYIISDFDRFYVEDPYIANYLFGQFSSLYSQVKNIMGLSWIKENPQRMKKIMDDPASGVFIMNLSKYNRMDSIEEKQQKEIYGKELKGSIFNTPDGVYCIIHDPSYAKPYNVSLNGGNSWIPAEEIIRGI